MTININFNLPFNEAIAQMASRGVVLPDIYYGQLQGIHRQLAFSIANITKVDQLQSVLDSLTTHLKDGGTFAQWQKAVDVKALGLPKHRLDNIFRTNIQQAYNHGHWQQALANQATHGYLMYDAINDSRTRPSHRANDGIIRKIDDPIWKRIWFSRSVYRCRCRLISLTEKQAIARSANDQGLYKTATEDPLRDKAWDSVDVMNADVMSFGVQEAMANRIANVTISPLLKNKAETMLEAWAGTNIAKRIAVNDIADIKLILDDYARLFPSHLPHGVKGVFAAKETDDFFMATDGKGTFHFSEIEHNGFNSKTDLLTGFSSIKSGKPLTQNQEYALECLWHEIWHNRQIGIEKVLLLDKFTETRLLTESVNQYVSRLSYGGFIESLGGKALHQQWVMENGYGYQIKVRRLNAIFDKLQIKDSIIGDLYNINANGDLLNIIDLLSMAIGRKTKLKQDELRLLLISVVADNDSDFLVRFNALLNPS